MAVVASCTQAAVVVAASSRRVTTVITSKSTVASCTQAARLSAIAQTTFLPLSWAVNAAFAQVAAAVAGSSSRQVATVVTNKSTVAGCTQAASLSAIAPISFLPVSWAASASCTKAVVVVAASSRRVATAASNKNTISVKKAAAAVAGGAFSFLAVSFPAIGVPQTPLGRMTGAAISYKKRAELPQLFRPIGRYGNCNAWSSAKRNPPDTYGEIEIPALEISATLSSSSSGTAVLEIPAPELSVTATNLWPTTMNAALLIDAPLIVAYGAATAVLQISAPQITFSAHRDTSDAALVVVAPVLVAYAGGAASAQIPAPALTAAGTVPVSLISALEIPALVLTAAGAMGGVGTAQMTVPSLELAASLGGYLSVEMPPLVVIAAGRMDGIATGVLALPSLELVATGQMYARATAALEIPSPVLYAGNGNRAILVLPGLEVSANGRVSLSVASYTAATAYASAVAAQIAAQAASGTPGEAAAIAAAEATLDAAVAAQTQVETTYAVNLTTGAVTTLLLGGFDKLMTAHGRLYGLKNGELTRLAGDIDPSNLKIPATVRLAPSTFGTHFVKRLATLYLSMREYDGVTLELVIDELKKWRYRTDTDTAPSYGTHKVSLGAGIRFHTVGLVLKNRNGGQFTLGGIDPLIEVLSRRPL